MSLFFIETHTSRIPSSCFISLKNTLNTNNPRNYKTHTSVFVVIAYTCNSKLYV
ncbi:hypothetical protein Hanom_Chr13g01215581 [Helianthus anomalus]